MYMQYRCLYQYSAYIFNIVTYSDPYSSIGATLLCIYVYTAQLELLVVSCILLSGCIKVIGHNPV